MKNIFSSSNIKNIIAECIREWHKNNKFIYKSKNVFEKKTVELTRNNYNLWHLEDKARIPKASNKILAETKIKIDKENQLRNNKIEEIDDYLSLYFNRKRNIQKKNAELNSETLGSIIDRISIITLKIYHFSEELERNNVNKNHIKNCENKLSILCEQRNDLLDCFDNLFIAILKGNKIQKTYKQFKMYNDPELNPEIYNRFNK